MMKLITPKFEITHTPGPWEIEEVDGGFTLRMGTAIGDPYECEVQHQIEMDFCLEADESNEQYIEAAANAQLIATSPDLLYACQAALAFLENRPEKGGETFTRDTLRKAIQKATTPIQP